MKRATFFGELRRENGKAVLIIPDKENVAQVAWETLGGNCFVKITVQEDDKGKDQALQRYFWSVVLPDITRAFNELGNRWSEDRAYEELKERMNVPFINGKRSTKRMTRSEYRQFVDECILFANEFLQIEIREPERAGGFPNEER
jgi:hypothetical protein